MIRSVNDYLTCVLPLCYGALALTGEEIAELTPWELEQRLKGFEERERRRRLFYASFVTVPVINAAGHPKRPVTVRKLLPEDAPEHEEVTKEQADRLKKLAVEAEGRRRADG